MIENRIIIADDHPMFLEGLKNALLNLDKSLYVETASSYLELFSLIEKESHDIDLILMDLKMPGATNEAGIYFIRKLYPEIPMIIISAHDGEESKSRCIASGASEFFSKSIEVDLLVKNINLMLKGGYKYSSRNKQSRNEATNINKIEKLTPSQFKVLHLMSNGHINKDIADMLNISEKTVKNHISAIFEKLQVSNRTQATKLFLTASD